MVCATARAAHAITTAVRVQPDLDHATEVGHAVAIAALARALEVVAGVETATDDREAEVEADLGAEVVTEAGIREVDHAVRVDREVDHAV